MINSQHLFFTNKFLQKNFSLISISIIFLIYFTLSFSAINEKQMVYGDMHNLYISQRLDDGLKLYEDINPLYGPILYYVGSTLIAFGLDYSLIKFFMLCISMSTGILVFLITKKISFDDYTAILATAIFMFLPIHYGIAPIFHSTQITVFLVLLAFYSLLFSKNHSLVIAAIFSTLAIFTKIPAVPFVIATLSYFLLRKNKQSLYFLIPLGIFSILGFSLIEKIKSNTESSQFLYNLLISKIELPFFLLRDFFWIEGLVFFISVIGMIIYFKSNKNILFLMITIGSFVSFSVIIFEGIGIYESNYFEPFLAIFASIAILHMKRNYNSNIFYKSIPIFLLILIFVQATIFISPDRERIADWDGNRWANELNVVADTHSIIIKNFSDKGDIVVTSPMAAYRTERILPLDLTYTELLLEKFNLGYPSAETDVKKLKTMLNKNEIALLITFNSTVNTNEKFDWLQEQRFFPFYNDDFLDILNTNYEKNEFEGFYYYLPKNKTFP
tara:strand:+ start:339 stop:1838 length:1500 start_codon:yes stop_codon:yes gene_type:complete